MIFAIADPNGDEQTSLGGSMAFDAETAARFILDAHQARAPFCNLPEAIGPRTLDEAYDAQESLHSFLAGRYGEAGGVKIATTTKVMQELMGIDRPSFGVIFTNRIHTSPAHLKLQDFISLKIECELAVRLGHDLAVSAAGYTAATISPLVQSIMPAFELVEDRRADYSNTSALSLIADNCWNAGVVLGRAVPYTPGFELHGLAGSLSIKGQVQKHGRTEDPLAAVAWVANMAAERRRPLRKGQIVMTGSIIPTLPISSGNRWKLVIEAIGEVELSVE
jgi:2-keto-4-pentenoate hydratase